MGQNYKQLRVEERNFLVKVNEAIFVNPFSNERTEIDRVILGKMCGENLSASEKEKLLAQKVSLEKLRYDTKDSAVIYRSKMTHGKNAYDKRNFQVFPPLEFIAAIAQHIPERSFQPVRYYGWYSNRMRGDRKKQEEREKEKREGEGATVQRPRTARSSISGTTSRSEYQN